MRFFSWVHGGTMAALVALAALGCGDDETTVRPGQLGVRGSSCQADNDCGAGLTCFSFRCVVRDFDVVASARSCTANFCDSDRDCCDFFEDCDFVNRECNDGRCTIVCASDDDCGFGFCVGGSCVECRSDDDCLGSDESCISGFCREPECQTNADCAPSVRAGIFRECQSERCVEVGCQNDRQCKAALNDATAICENTGVSTFDRCIVPCDIDAQCRTSDEFDFIGCVDRRCQYLGCQDDVECAAQCTSIGCGDGGGGFTQPPAIEYLCVDPTTT